MKKSVISILTLVLAIAFLSSCRSSKPSCAAYDQVQLEELAK